MKSYVLSCFFLLTIFQLSAQDYRYLQIVIDSADNFQFRALEWFDDGLAHPQVAMTAYNAPAPLLVTGDNANWNLYYLYDHDHATQSYVNEVRSNPEFTREFTLDLGEGNTLSPDSIRISKPAWSVLTSFRILLSNDAVNWELYLDTTRNHVFAETLTYPLNLIVDTEPPSPPQNIANPYKTASQIYVEWTASTDNFRVVQYHIYQDGVLIDSTQATYYAAQNLTASTSYDFQIYALDKARNLSQFGAISISTLSADEIAPILSKSLEIIDLSASTATFRWQSALETQGLSGYIIQLNGETVGTTSDTTFSVCGLDTLTTYTVEVFAKDNAQNVSNPLKTTFRTLLDNRRMQLGTNFWNQNWSPENNQLFVNGHQNVTGDNPWKPELLVELDYAQTLRFMEMQVTNQNPIIPAHTWLDRKKKTDTNQDELAYEWMIDLCNRKNANLWVCLPNRVIDRTGFIGGRENYIKKLAILLKTGVDMGDTNLEQAIFSDLKSMTRHDFILNGGKSVCEPLASHLKIYIEYGNENWNANFPQTTYGAEEGLAMDFGWGPVSAGRLFSAYASLKLFEEFAAVFGQNATRIETILPIQRHGIFYTDLSFTEIFDDPVFNPNGILPEYISGATYFSNGEDGADANIAQIMLEDISGIMDEVRGMRTYLEEAGTERNHHFGLISYEGGHHITTNFEDLNANPIIYDTYLTFLDSMNLYFEEIVLYSHVARNAFGLKQYIDQPLAEAHKYRAVVDWLPTVVADSTFCQKEVLLLNEDTIVNSVYKATDSLISQSLLPTNTKATFTASEMILLQSGFQVELGADFRAVIDGCNTVSNSSIHNSIFPNQTKRATTFNATVEKITVKIAPNPVQSEMIIRYYLPELTEGHIQLFDVNGQLLKTQNFSNQKGWQITKLNTHFLPSGTYFLHLVTTKKSLTKKIIKH